MKELVNRHNFMDSVFASNYVLAINKSFIF